MNKLAEICAALIGGAVHHVEVIHGGDLSEIQGIVLADGREAIVMLFTGTENYYLDRRDAE